MSIPVQCNLTGFVPDRSGGAQVFLEGLLPELARFPEIAITVHGSNKTKTWVDGLTDSSVGFNVVGRASHRLIDRFFATRKMKASCRPGDIIWSPLNQGAGQFAGVKEVLTIHDLIPLHYSQDSTAYPKNLRRKIAFSIRWKNSIRIAKRASAVMAVSNSCVKPLQEALGSDHPTVFGAPNGIDPIKLAAANVKGWSYTGNRSVIAITSGTMPHKGLQTLERVAEKMPDFEFRLIGRRSSPIQRDNVNFTGRLSHDELADEFRNASALFFPSRIEGFGLPVLEALVFGTPVVASDIPVLREVGGEASKYFTLDDIEDAQRKIEQVVTCRETSLKMSLTGKQHATQFTWKAAAEKYLEVFQLTNQL